METRPRTANHENERETMELLVPVDQNGICFASSEVNLRDDIPQLRASSLRAAVIEHYKRHKYNFCREAARMSSPGIHARVSNITVNCFGVQRSLGTIHLNRGIQARSRNGVSTSFNREEYRYVYVVWHLHLNQRTCGGGEIQNVTSNSRLGVNKDGFRREVIWA